MTCDSCEKRVESVARSIGGVYSANAESAKGKLTALLEPGADPIDVTARIGRALSVAGYPAGQDAPRPWRDGVLAAAVGTGLAAAFYALDHSGLVAFAPRQGATAAALAASGLLTSFHCVSMCGGIALSQSLRAAIGEVAQPVSGGSSRYASLKSAVAYNAGRVVGYTAIGALVGALGGALDLGQRGRSIVMFVAAAFMTFMGLRLAGVLPARRSSGRTAFGRFRDAVGAKAIGLGPFVVGLANALMPCGPLQAAQAFALASGSALAGALSMLAFSLGTVPLMLVFGAGGSLLSARFRTVAARAGGVLVLFLGLSAFGRAWALSGIRLDSSVSVSAPAAPAAGIAPSAVQTVAARGASPVVAVAKDGFQEVSFDLAPRSYSRLLVASGVPVRLTIRADSRSINGCNNAVVIPAYGVTKELAPGDNLIEFTPEATGVIPYSCWMGMIRSTIEVVEPNDPRLEARR